MAVQGKPHSFQDTDVVVLKTRNIQRESEALGININMVFQMMMNNPSVFLEGDYYRVLNAEDFFTELKKKRG